MHRGFLIERYGHDRWTVHDLVVSIGMLSLAHDLVKSGHAAFGRHYNELAEAAGENGDEGTWFDPSRAHGPRIVQWKPYPAASAPRASINKGRCSIVAGCPPSQKGILIEKRNRESAKQKQEFWSRE